MSTSLAGKVAVVTGAARGIGRASAKAFARRGAALVLVSRSTTAAPNRAGLPGSLESVGEELEKIGVPVELVPADLSRPDDVERVVEATMRRFGRCDVLVNNAALSFLGTFLEVPQRRWSTVFAVNLHAPVALMQAFLPGMLDRTSGRIVNMTSAAAATRDKPAGTWHPYAASKAALEAASFGLAAEMRDSGVAVNVLAPVVRTEALGFHIPDQIDALSGEMAMPDQYGDAVAWVVEQPAAYTGRYLDNAALVACGALLRR